LKQQLITPKEAASRLGLSTITLAIWRCRRPLALRYHKLRNGRIMYGVDDVDALAAARASMKTTGGGGDEGPTCSLP